MLLKINVKKRVNEQKAKSPPFSKKMKSMIILCPFLVAVR